MEQIYVCVLVGLFMLIVVIAFWAILAQRKLSKYLPFLLVLLMISPSAAQDDEIVLIDVKPMVFPEPLKTASATMGNLAEDLLWRAGIAAFLGNNSTNLTMGLYYA